MTRARWLLLPLAAMPLFGQQGDQRGEVQQPLPPGLVVPPAIVRSAAEELATFAVPADCTVELVASEPLVCDPVVATFDEAGRLWVVEMPSYMRDVDAGAEHTADGRVVVLDDVDGDGAMDRRSVFLDGLVLPRAVLPLRVDGRQGALVVAPPQLCWAEDRDGDGRAEHVQAVMAGFDAGLQNPEHSGNGLLWGLDNAIHLANDARVVRWSKTGFAVEAAAGGGQWGISQDDRGRLFFNYNEDWLRADLVPGRYRARAPDQDALAGCNHRVVTDTSVWPIRVTPGVNRGYRPGMLKDGVLTRHTAVCAPFVYRGNTLPAAQGDVFVCEPAANLVRRFRLDDHDGLLRGSNRYDHREFLASTDERFRPVYLGSGPDGALYVVDMYRGVIQHRNFVTTFLRQQILARGLEQPTGHGRIWRIRAAAARPAPRLLSAAGVGELVAALGDADGWRRDQAERLLVLRQDPQAVVPLRERLRGLLRELPARTDAAPACISVLAALDGLQAIDSSDLRATLHRDDAGLLAFALQRAAPYLRLGDAVLWTQCEALAAHRAPTVRWHLALALGDVDGVRGARAVRLLAAIAGGAAPDDRVLRDCLVNAGTGREPALVRALAATGGSEATAGLFTALARAAGQRRDAAAHDELLAVAAACMQSWQQRALLAGLLDALPKDPARRPGFYTFAVTPPALAAMARTGDPAVQQLVAQLLAVIAIVPVAAPPTATGDDDLPAEARAAIAGGSRVYATYCAACHQLDGRGMGGLAPPLRESEWVTGAPERLIRIALHGVRGSITAAGTAYDGEMPGQGHLGDVDLSAVLSFVRRSWGHRSAPVAPADVAAIRAQHRSRAEPWTAAELGSR